MEKLTLAKIISKNGEFLITDFEDDCIDLKYFALNFINESLKQFKLEPSQVNILFKKITNLNTSQDRTFLFKVSETGSFTQNLATESNPNIDQEVLGKRASSYASD